MAEKDELRFKIEKGNDVLFVFSLLPEKIAELWNWIFKKEKKE